MATSMFLKGNETSSQDCATGARMLEHIHAHARLIHWAKGALEQKELEETKLITAYIRDDWIRKQMIQMRSNLQRTRQWLFSLVRIT